ncbi:hypothetical protein U1Q18_012487 [Sarracenia purpurea var. burkii]
MLPLLMGHVVQARRTDLAYRHTGSFASWDTWSRSDMPTLLVGTWGLFLRMGCMVQVRRTDLAYGHMGSSPSQGMRGLGQTY